MPGKGGSLLGPLADAELGEAGLGRVALHPDAQLLRRHRLRRRPHRRESPPGCCAGGGGEAEAAGAGAELDRGGHHRARHLSQQVAARSSEPLAVWAVVVNRVAQRSVAQVFSSSRPTRYLSSSLEPSGSEFVFFRT